MLHMLITNQYDFTACRAYSYFTEAKKGGEGESAGVMRWKGEVRTEPM